MTFSNYCLRLLSKPTTFVFLVFSFVPISAPCASTQVWELSEHGDFLLGEFKNISLLQSGALAPAPRLEPLFQSDQPVIWTAAVADDGTIYVGTGHQGKVYRLGLDGKVDLFWNAPEIEVFALAIGPSGELYAGTSPKGKLYRINSQGIGEAIFDPGQAYIWSLVVAPTANAYDDGVPLIYMATGGEGKIYAVEASGQGRIFAETKQRHVVSLALNTKGQLLAGTDPNGIVYLVDKDGKIFGLYDSDQPEVRSLQVMSNGDIYAAAMGSGGTQVTQAVLSFSSISANPAGNIPPGNPLVNPVPTPKLSSTHPTTKISQPTTYPGLERSALLRIRIDRGVEKLWSSSDENILAVEVQGNQILESGDPDDTASGVRILFATDRKGRIYELADWRRGTQRQVSLLHESGRQQITQLLTDQRGLLVASAHSANLSRLHRRGSAAGIYESVIHDAKTFARWGQLLWEGYATDRERFRIWTRSGNSSLPDTSWSVWSEVTWDEVETGHKETFLGGVVSPPARYIQWKASLSTKDQIIPMLRKVRLTYLPRNVPPKITGLSVKPSNREHTASADDMVSETISQTAGAHTISVSASGSPVPVNVGATTRGVIGGGLRRDLKISWKAHDSDGDQLTTSIAFREVGGSIWKVVEEDIKGDHFFLDSETLADGVYRFRIVISDRISNPPEFSYETEEMSEPVLIDHTPPQVNVLEIRGREAVIFEAVDKGSSLATAEYAIDAGKWTPIYSKDGILDSRRERFLILPQGLSASEHLLTLRVRDRSGNSGLGKVLLQ